jgi:tellurite resistance protein TerC
MGLRALYFALAAMVHRFHYLKLALAVVLIFIGSKIFAAPLLGVDKIPPWISLAVPEHVRSDNVLRAER